LYTPKENYMETAIFIFSGLMLGSIIGKLVHIWTHPDSITSVEPGDIFGTATAILIIIDRFFV